MPLERWAVSFSTSSAELELSIEAITPPLELEGASDAAPELMSGVKLYEQLCRVRGTVHVNGGSRSVRAVGRRVHAWGAHDWNELARWRSLYAASEEGRAISLAAALPRNASGHGEEVHAASLLAPDEEPHAFEDVRVSTVWGPDGLPVKAGLELYLAEEEMPRRIAGESVCRTTVDLSDEALGISFFRWSFEGTPALGCYETLTRNT
jgi:hypothetical protein